MASDPGRRWDDAFADPTGTAFGEILADTVELDGSIFTRSVHGRHAVWSDLRTASGIYERVEFTERATAGHRLFLEWTATALGMRMDGVTVLTPDADGNVARVAVYHRPLAAVFAFSAEMARRIAPGPGADHFYWST